MDIPIGNGSGGPGLIIQLFFYSILGEGVVRRRRWSLYDTLRYSGCSDRLLEKDKKILFKDIHFTGGRPFLALGNGKFYAVTFGKTTETI